MQRYICIHGHFYQPPRENPWLETVEVQDSAYPYHDWNERVTAECYAPNADSRILADDGRIARIVNNYTRISFNFGPTLLAWLESHDPRTYASILDADRESAERFAGHGSAMAQVYNHAILPLANERDQRTQVIWGIRDFEHRFGRKPEGMWLPETAVDTASLEALARQGIRFTVLAPSQAAAVRPLGTEEWSAVNEQTLDTSVPYRVDLPEGGSISVFFYNGAVSRAVAFEHLLASGEKFAGSLLGQFPTVSDRARLVHIATDGETYGHHHRFGNMALAFALQSIETNESAQLTNYGEFLALHPPQHAARIVENSSWSCAHGVERWRDACGCTTGTHAGWHQRWRKPLREALDWLRDEMIPLFEREAWNYFAEPWRARDAYVELILDRSNGAIDRFLERVSPRPLQGAEQVRALKLLESQRQAQLMYTSCAWFFEEISGIETVQNLQYAARAIQLGEELFGVPLEQPFLERLALAPSNVADCGDGRKLYERRVAPAKVDLPRIAANAAASFLFGEDGTADLVRGFEIDADECGFHEAGRARLMLGRLSVVSRVTREHGDFDFAFLHLGDHNLNGAVRPRSDDAEFRALSAELSKDFEARNIPGVLRTLEQRFDGSADSLRTLFRDEQRRILERILESTELEAEDVQLRLYREHAPLMRFITSLETQSPPALQAAAELVLNIGLRRELELPEFDPARLQTLFDEARSVGVALDGAGLGYAARAALERLMARLDDSPEDRSLLERVMCAAKLFLELPFEVDLRRVENGYFRLLEGVAPEVRKRAAAKDAEALRWIEIFEELGDTLRFAGPPQAS